MVVVKVLCNLESVCITADIAQCGPRRLPHHLPQRACQNQPFFPFHPRGLNKDDITARLGPDQPCGNADPVFGLGNLIVELPRTQVSFHLLGGNDNWVGLPSLLQGLPSDFPTDGTDLSLEVPEPSLPGVCSNDLPHRLTGEIRGRTGEAGGFNLPGY